MTKADLADRITQKAQLNRSEALQAVQTILDSLTTSLQHGDKVELRGFGSFRIRARKPRLGRNPKTGERVDVPAKKIVHFKPGRNLQFG
ncbi:MAG TPA: HU family DNA-binding protein [Acidobacteriota bacterium]|nr:HU family DNA-binding protein [Acidobacteriota bacterium]